MTPQEAMLALRKRWWLVILVPAVVLPLLILRARIQPFQSSLNAVVLIPGDTEIPGNSERPELMVLDDLPALVASRVFAEAVTEHMSARDGAASEATDVNAVQAALSGSRYSRILTVTVTQESRDDARRIAESAAAVLPGVINRYLVADSTSPATVQIIDPPSEPTRSRPNQTLILTAMTLVAIAVGAGLALAAEGWSNVWQGRPDRIVGVEDAR